MKPVLGLGEGVGPALGAGQPGLGALDLSSSVTPALQMPACPDHPVFEGLVETPPPPGGLP